MHKNGVLHIISISLIFKLPFEWKIFFFHGRVEDILSQLKFMYLSQYHMKACVKNFKNQLKKQHTQVKEHAVKYI